MIALACYFDESERTRERYYAVAGYLGSVDVWDHVFTPEWKAMLARHHNILEFKASACRKNRETFADACGWTEEERHAITMEAIDLITTKSDAVGYAMVVRFPSLVAEGREATSKEVRRVELIGYEVASSFCVADVLRFHSRDFGPHEYLRPIPDKKPGFYEAFTRGMSKALEWANDDWRTTYEGKIKDPIGEHSHELPPLQAADLLAYETRLELENRIAGKPASPYLEPLVNGRRHFARCAVYEDLPVLFPTSQGSKLPYAEAEVLYASGFPIRGKGFWPDKLST